MKSIKYKFLLVILSVLVGFTVLLLITNTFFLDDYYVYKTKSSFIASADHIVNTFQSDNTNLLNYLREENSITGYKLMISNSQNEILYSSVPEFKVRSNQKISQYQRVLIEENQDIFTSSYFYGTGYDENKGYSSVTFIDVLPDGNYLIISQPMHQITESAHIANNFFILCGAIMLVIATIISILFASRFVRPVLEITKITKSIASLDFSAVYKGASKDEIGTLGEGINTISHKLSQAINELNIKNTELQKEMNLQNRFIASISHEFNTPVGLIQGYTEAIEKKMYKSESQRQEMTKIILKETGRLNRLVSDILMITKVESKNFSLSKHSVKLSELLKESIVKFKGALAKKEIDIRLLASYTDYILIDDNRIIQVIDNLLKNAIKKTFINGSIEIKCNNDGNNVKTTIFNTGKNIKHEHLENLFTPFYQAEEARSNDGNGLGLSIVNSIITAHNGECGVLNSLNGVTFWFTLPL